MRQWNICFKVAQKTAWKDNNLFPKKLLAKQQEKERVRPRRKRKEQKKRGETMRRYNNRNGRWELCEVLYNASKNLWKIQKEECLVEKPRSWVCADKAQRFCESKTQSLVHDINALWGRTSMCGCSFVSKEQVLKGEWRVHSVQHSSPIYSWIFNLFMNLQFDP